jgi:outer membrane protein TolC
MARYDSRPDFMVGYSRAFTGQRPDLSGPDIPGEGKDSVGVFVQMNLPVWGAKNRSRVQEAVQKKREADAQVAAEQNKIRADFSELFFTLANRRRLVEIYRDTILPQAKTAMESANAFFQNDSSNFADYLETASTFYALQIAALRAEADLFSSAADLEKFVGMPFELTESAGQK